MVPESCVYCEKDSTTSKSLAHIFPEGLYPGGPALKRGIVCDRCNHYFGAKLESVLIAHPLIALPLQLMGIPGKEGKARKKLSIYERDVEPDAEITFPIAPPKFSRNTRGERTATFQPLVDRKFDMDRFRRALYHIGFNLVVANRGIQESQDPRYRPLRTYVRRPRTGERWPFVQALTHSLKVFVPKVGAELLDVKGREIVRMRIFNTQFYVDLLNSGCLLSARTEGSATVIGPEWKAHDQEKAAPGVHYRVSILKREPL